MYGDSRKMTHKHSMQANIVRNCQIVKKYIAQCMPLGAKDQKLKAILYVKEGFSEYALIRYLSNLLEAEEIEFDYETRVWYLPEGATDNDRESEK